MANAKFLANVPLAPYTTMGVGGSARCMARVTSTTDMIRALQWGDENNLPVFVLGGGSNVVFADRGYPGMVLQPMLRGIVAKHVGTRLLFSVGAGESWDSFVSYCVRCNMGGAECLSGIPGTVGAAPIQNIGAYGQEVSQVIDSVTVLDRTTMLVEEHEAEWCRFSYRSSIFKEQPERYIVTKVTFSLKANTVAVPEYADLQRWFEKHPLCGGVSLDTVRRAVLEVRSAKGMIYDKAQVTTHGCGSFFVNPTVNAEEFQRIIDGANALGLSRNDIPSHQVSEQEIKISAAWLIEKSGFLRGYCKEGTGVGLNPFHALAIINYGNATSRQILELMNEIKESVAKNFNIELVPEPTLVGFKEKN